MTDSNQNPQVPNYVPGVGRLVTDRFDFQKHVGGADFRHQSNQIDMVPPITIDGYTPTNIQDAITILAGVVSPPTIRSSTIGNNPANLGIITLGGDLKGNGSNSTALSPVVGGLQGRPISATSPSNGQVLGWNGSSWTPTNSAGGSPTGSAGGDLSGVYPNPTVAKINGVLVTNAPTSGQVLSATGINTAQWQDATSTTTVTMVGDVVGSSNSNKISTITGNSTEGGNYVTINAALFNWANDAGNVVLSQTNIASTPASSFSIKAQNSIAANGIGGNLNLSSGAGTGSGRDGYINFLCGPDNLASYSNNIFPIGGSINTQLSTGIKHKIAYATSPQNNFSTSQVNIIVSTPPSQNHAYNVAVNFIGRVIGMDGYMDGYFVRGKNAIVYYQDGNGIINIEGGDGTGGTGAIFALLGDSHAFPTSLTFALDGSNNLLVRINLPQSNLPVDWKFEVTIMEN